MFFSDSNVVDQKLERDNNMLFPDAIKVTTRERSVCSYCSHDLSVFTSVSSLLTWSVRLHFDVITAGMICLSSLLYHHYWCNLSVHVTLVSSLLAWSVCLHFGVVTADMICLHFGVITTGMIYLSSLWWHHCWHDLSVFTLVSSLLTWSVCPHFGGITAGMICLFSLWCHHC